VPVLKKLAEKILGAGRRERLYPKKDKSGSRYFHLNAMLYIICECAEWAILRGGARVDGFMYMAIMVRASQDFQDLAQVCYDAEGKLT